MSIRVLKIIEEGYITLDKLENQKGVIKNIKTPYKSQGKVIKLFDDCSRIVSEAKYKTKYGEVEKGSKF